LESSSSLSFKIIIKSAVKIDDGRAITAIPKIDESIVKVLPTTVTGYKSPYPTVVSDTVAQYRALKKFLKVSGSTLYTIKADTKI